MILDLFPLLVTVACAFALRFAIWRMLMRGRTLASRLLVVAARATEYEPVRTVVSFLRLRFPRTVRLIQARLTPRRFTGLPLALIVASALYVVGLLAGLIEELLEADELIRFDESVNAMLNPLRSQAVVAVFGWLTELGGSAALAAVSIVTTGLLWAHGRAYMVPALWITLIGSQITTYAGKFALARERPEFLADFTALTPSFPSGHATSAMAVYGFIAYVLVRDLNDPRQRFEIVYWGAFLIGLIGFSRILLSVHYVSDVAAGFLVGGFWLLVGFAVSEHLRR